MASQSCGQSFSMCSKLHQESIVAPRSMAAFAQRVSSSGVTEP